MICITGVIKIILQGNVVCGLLGEMNTCQEPVIDCQALCKSDIDGALQIQYIIHLSELEWKLLLCLIIFVSVSKGKALKRYCEIQCNKTFNFSFM